LSGFEKRTAKGKPTGKRGHNFGFKQTKLSSAGVSGAVELVQEGQNKIAIGGGEGYFVPTGKSLLVSSRMWGYDSSGGDKTHQGKGDMLMSRGGLSCGFEKGTP